MWSTTDARQNCDWRREQRGLSRRLGYWHSCAMQKGGSPVGSRLGAKLRACAQCYALIAAAVSDWACLRIGVRAPAAKTLGAAQRASMAPIPRTDIGHLRNVVP